MPKKVMENVYLYDKKQYVAPSDYNEPDQKSGRVSLWLQVYCGITAR